MKHARHSFFLFFAALLLSSGIATAQQNGVNFDGSSTYAIVPTSTLPNYTIECWVKFTGSTTAGQNIFVYTNASGPTVNFSHQLFTNASGHFQHYSYDGSLHNVTGTTVAALNTWYHVAITGTSNGYVRLYVNGVQEGTASAVGSLWTGGDRINVAGNSGLASLLEGTVDELRIWNRELCATEINANMNGELLNPSTQSGLHRYYKFDQGTASGTNTGLTSMTDLSANAVNGTLYNFALSGSTGNWVAGTSSITGTLAASYNALDMVALSSSTSTFTVSGSTVASNCALISGLTPSGAAPLSGTVTAKVTLDGTAQTYHGQAYVPRHYDIEPVTNPNTATATVTLYFAQSDFDAFNLIRGSLPSLPTSTSDASDAANLRISQFHGIPSGGNAPGNYPATWGGTGPAHLLITPGSVTYNSTYARWEVVFPVTGFSGFFVSTGSTTLPISLSDFRVNAHNANDVHAQWTAPTVQPNTVFELERSRDGNAFATVGKLSAVSAGDYSMHDYAPEEGLSFYRLRTTDADGGQSFSEVESVNIHSNAAFRISPIPAGDYLKIETDITDGTVTLINMQGQELLYAVLHSSCTLDVQQLPAGIYLLRFSDGRMARVVKQ